MKRDIFEYFFHKEYDKFLGLEVADGVIKALYLSKDKNGLCLQNGGIYKLKPNVIVENQIKEESQLIDILNDIKSDLLISDKDFPLGLSFPGQSTVSKLLKVNKELYGSEQERFIQQEISKQLHKQDVDICLDYHIFSDDSSIDGSPVDESPFYDVIAVTALQKEIDQRVTVARAANFNPRVVDVDYLSLAGAANFLLPDDFGDVTALFYLGHCSISLIVMNHFNVIYSKETSIDSELWKYLSYDLEEFSKNDNNQKENTESLNNDNESSNDLESTVLPDNYTDILVSGDIVSQFTEQCHSLLQFFYSSQSGLEVKKIILAGCFNTEKENVINQSLKEKFNIEGEFLDFKNKLIMSDLAQNNKILQKIAPDMMVSLGVALRGFDND